MAGDEPPESGESPADPLDPALAQELVDKWESITPTLLVHGLRLTKKPDRARDLVHSAYLQIRLGKRKWHRDKQPDLALFVCGVMGSIWTNKRSSAPARREVSLDPEVDDEPPASQPGLDEMIDMKAEYEEAEQMVHDIEAGLPEGDVARGVLRLGRQGHTEPAEQAALLDVSIDDVTNARRRLNYARKRWLTERRRKAARKVGP